MKSTMIFEARLDVDDLQIICNALYDTREQRGGWSKECRERTLQKCEAIRQLMMASDESEMAKETR